jgi:hypothetical protein
MVAAAIATATTIGVKTIATAVAARRTKTEAMAATGVKVAKIAWVQTLSVIPFNVQC